MTEDEDIQYLYAMKDTVISRGLNEASTLDI